VWRKHLKISIIVALCGDEDINGVAATIGSIDAAARPMGKPFEIIVACAENCRELEGKWGSADEGLLANVRFCDLGFRDYYSVAQLKNAALSHADGDYVTYVDAGTVLPVDYFDRLWDSGLGSREALDIISGGMGCIEGFMLPRSVLDEFGGFNGLLDDNGMELLLRVVTNGGAAYAILKPYGAPLVWNDTDLYPYVLGKYAGFMRDNDAFDRIVGGYLLQAGRLGVQEHFVERLSHMMAQDGEFLKLDRATLPVVVYMGDPICFDVLTCFAREFSRALKSNGVPVIMYDMSKEGTGGLSRFVDRQYRCVVGFQTALMSVTYNNSEKLVNNRIGGPKVNFLYDHPLYLYYHFTLDLENQWVLTQDERYAEYINKYYPRIKKAYHLPPAGIELEGGRKEKTYDVSFVGSYHDYRERMLAVEQLEEPYRSIALECVRINMDNPSLSAEEAMERTMRSRGESWDADEFALNMHRCMDANRVVMFHYREKVVETLLNAGIRVDVFGETWNNCPLRDNPLLVIHGDVGYMEGIGILAASRISLNVMSWHKAGMTERIANSMLNHALCLTDTTDYLEKHFTDGEDIVLFRLDRLGELPDKVRGLLGDAALVDRITENAYANASANHRWCNRARDFVAMLEMGAFEE
jgi:hypothetical protein